MTPTTEAEAPLVVYVDDEEANRTVFELSIGSVFNVLTCATPEEVFKALDSYDVAVVVTDMRMPTMSGEQLLRVVKEKYPRTIRMVMTAYSDVEPILRAINEGLVARYIVKPWERTEVVQILRWAIGAWTFSRDSEALQRRLLDTERLVTLGTISGMLVHDLKQPVVSLLVNLELLAELTQGAPMIQRALLAADPKSPERDVLLRALGDIDPLMADLKASAEHLNHMISNLREFSRPRDPKTTPMTDPLPILRHAMAVCQQISIHAGASVDYIGPTELPRVTMPATELTQVLINVLSNGAQAVAARGKTNGHVSIAVHANDDSMLEFRIKDDGVGMKPEVLSKVGTPFFTTRTEGTGLGIAQCQRLVGTAGGRLMIESEVGIGTTVTIILPISAAKHEAARTS